MGTGEGRAPGKARYTIEVRKSARKEILSLPAQVGQRIEDSLDRLQEDPFHPRPGLDVRPLAGWAGLWRLRVGDYRILYCVEGQTIHVTEAGHRSTVYR